MEVREGDYVLLRLDDKRKYLVRAEKGRMLHTHKGIVDLGSLVGAKYGDYVESHLNAKFRVLKPTIVDFVRFFSRGTQVIYPKDAALMIVLAGIGPGSRVVEAGTGSGALAALLAYYVRPDGVVYSYDVKESVLEIARRNLRKAGVADWVVLKRGDVTEEIEERGVDAVFLDLSTPWLVVKNASDALKSGGSFVSFSPTINQVEKTVEELRAHDFVDVVAIEAIVRRYRVKAGKTRPEMFMVGHTGYIVLARKP